MGSGLSYKVGSRRDPQPLFNVPVSGVQCSFAVDLSKMPDEGPGGNTSALSRLTGLKVLTGRLIGLHRVFYNAWCHGVELSRAVRSAVMVQG